MPSFISAVIEISLKPFLLLIIEKSCFFDISTTSPKGTKMPLGDYIRKEFILDIFKFFGSVLIISSISS